MEYLLENFLKLSISLVKIENGLELQKGETQVLILQSIHNSMMGRCEMRQSVYQI